MASESSSRPPAEQAAYLSEIESLVRAKVPILGVHLYSLARPSFQPEAPRLAALDPALLAEFARAIEAKGMRVELSP